MAKINFNKTDLLTSLLSVSPLTLHQLQNSDIVIIGQPASGKTYLSELIKGEEQAVIHTDGYLKAGQFLEDLNEIFETIDTYKSIGQSILVEGVGGYRLLRKGLETGRFYPKAVIDLSITDFKSEWIYKTERPNKDYKKVQSMIKGNAKVFKDYQEYYNPFKPLLISVLNNW